MSLKRTRFTIKVTIADEPMPPEDLALARRLLARMAARAYLDEYLRQQGQQPQEPGPDAPNVRGDSSDTG